MATFYLRAQRRWLRTKPMKPGVFELHCKRTKCTYSILAGDLSQEEQLRNINVFCVLFTGTQSKYFITWAIGLQVRRRKTLIYLLGKASYNRNNSRNNTDEHRWDIANPETNAALSKGQYITEGRVLTRNEFKRTDKSFVVQLSWIVHIPHGNPQSL